MSNQDQAYFWLQKAEYWRQLLDEAEARYKARLESRGVTDETEIQYQTYMKAKDDPRYQRAGRKMAGAEQRATMYALFALLEK